MKDPEETERLSDYAHCLSCGLISLAVIAFLAVYLCVSAWIGSYK